MGILDSILANGGNVKLALEDHEILQTLDGDASVDDATQLALAKAASDQSPDPVAVSAQDVLTVSNELSEEIEGTDEAEDTIMALENISFAVRRAAKPLDLAIAYESYSSLCKATKLPLPKTLSVEDLDSDLEGQRKLALEGIAELKSKLMGLVTGGFERVSKLLTKAGETTAIAGKEQTIRSKSLLGGLFGSRNWDPAALVTIPKSGLERYGKAAANPLEFSSTVINAIDVLFNGGNSLWSDFVGDYLGWVNNGCPADPGRFSRYLVPEKQTAVLPLHPRLENNKIVFDKVEPYKGDAQIAVGEKTYMKNLLANTNACAQIFVSMDKFFGNFENHYGDVKKKLDEYIAKRSEEDPYFKDRTAEDFREVQRRIERAIDYFVALAAYFVEVNKFLLDFATAAVAAGETKK